MFWNYFTNRFAKIVQNATVDEIFQLLHSEQEFSEKAQEALILRENEKELRCYFVRERFLSAANQVLLIERMPSLIIAMLSHQSVCDKAAEMIVRQGNSDNIELLLINQSIPVELQKMIVERGVSKEITAMLIKCKELSPEACEAIIKRGVDTEIKLLLQNYNLPQEIKQSVIARRNADEQVLVIEQGLLNQESVSQIIDCGHHEAIMALLQAIDDKSPVHLTEEDRDKIIFRDNQDEIMSFIKNDFLATEKGILHLIDIGFHDCAAMFLNTICQGYNPITEKVVTAVLENGPELLGVTLLHRQDVLLSQLKEMNKTQEWLENKVLERGYKDEISLLARIYKVSDYTKERILRNNVAQEITALINGKNISDAFVYDLIDRQCYDLLENYARNIPNNPTFYLLTKYMKAHH